MSLKELEKEHGLTQRLVLCSVMLQGAIISRVHALFCVFLMLLSFAAMIFGGVGFEEPLHYVAWFCFAFIFCVTMYQAWRMKEAEAVAEKRIEEAVALDLRLDKELKYRAITDKKKGRKRGLT